MLVGAGSGWNSQRCHLQLSKCHDGMQLQGKSPQNLFITLPKLKVTLLNSNTTINHHLQKIKNVGGCWEWLE